MPIAIVTGCLGAIGRATCIELAAAGFDLVGIDRHPDAMFGEVSYYACDLADSAAITATLKAIRAAHGQVELLVNNAAHYDPKPFFDTSLADFDTSYSINVRAIFQLSQEVARWMVDDGVSGAIVNIASIAGKIGSPIIPYGTSKAAVIGLTRSMAKALAPLNIRVNAIAPGIISSPMSDAVNPEQMRVQLSNVATGRLGEPAEIAAVVRFLGSPAASFMAGSIVDVAGGWMS
jgi:NAD(P)-dependent dehydrogenase (short-subunit alcohol dehydrogenase family)